MKVVVNPFSATCWAQLRNSFVYPKNPAVASPSTGREAAYPRDSPIGVVRGSLACEGCCELVPRRFELHRQTGCERPQVPPRCTSVESKPARPRAFAQWLDQAALSTQIRQPTQQYLALPEAAAPTAELFPGAFLTLDVGNFDFPKTE